MKNIFLVSFDIGDSKRNEEVYPKISELFKKMGGHEPLKNIWLVSYEMDETQILKKVLSILDREKDRIVIQVILKKPLFSFAKSGTDDWIARSGLL